MLRQALVLLYAIVAAAASNDRERSLREAVWGGHWIEGVRLYGGVEAAGLAPSPQASYLAGLAQWRLHHPEEARPLLEKAAKAGFRPSGGRPQPDELQGKIDEYFRLRPARTSIPAPCHTSASWSASL